MQEPFSCPRLCRSLLDLEYGFMSVGIIEETVAALAEYATVPIAFEVRETFARDCPAEGTSAV